MTGQQVWGSDHLAHLSSKMVRLFHLTTIGLLLYQAPIAEAVICFEDKATLRAAALRYGDGSPEAQRDAVTYGAEIQKWCFDKSLTDLSGLFDKAHAFNANLAGWNVSAVTDMSNMFAFAFEFTSDLTFWNVSSVTDMGQMFAFAASFNADISIWDVSSVKDMKCMFCGAHSLTADLSRWSVSSVEDMRYMFSSAHSFNVDLSGWDVSSVKDMKYMFHSATAFNQNLCPWKDSLQGFKKTAKMFENTACPFEKSPTSVDSQTFCQKCSPALPVTCKGKRESCSATQECCGNRICFSLNKKCLRCRKANENCGKNSDCCGKKKCKNGQCK